MEPQSLKVSAVIPAYNRKAYIDRALQSILSQTTPVDEIIVVDDGSTDGTADYVEGKYGAQVRVVRQKNSGVSGARRRGIQEARGQWIAFLDSDDEWVPERNHDLLLAAERVPPDVAWIFGDLRVVTDEGEKITLFQEFGLTVPEFPYVFPDVFAVQYPFQFGLLQGSLIRRQVLLDLNCFQEGLHSSEDLLTGFQVACRYRYAGIPRVVGKYFRTSDLAASSAIVAGVTSPDYFRARMIAFSAVIATGRRSPWNQRYAAEVRGLCQLLAERRQPVPMALPFRQFRFGAFSLKGLAFAGAALLGAPGIRLWNRLTSFRRKHVASPAASVPSGGFRGYMDSVVEKSE
ncbi:MAG: glycosyltransferase family 2 protein [Acidobacteria bacterium]|nr:glycosyltransferase family 2 protein [Acidobacteriota bacterium]